MDSPPAVLANSTQSRHYLPNIFSTTNRMIAPKKPPPKIQYKNAHPAAATGIIMVAVSSMFEFLSARRGNAWRKDRVQTLCPHHRAKTEDQAGEQHDRHRHRGRQVRGAV